MTPSEQLIRRIQSATLPWAAQMSERKMFGGHCFLYKGKMCLGETKERLMVRVKPEDMAQTLAMDEVMPMDFTGKPMKEMVFVAPKGYDTEAKLQHFIELGIAHAEWKTSAQL